MTASAFNELNVKRHFLPFFGFATGVSNLFAHFAVGHPLTGSAIITAKIFMGFAALTVTSGFGTVNAEVDSKKCLPARTFTLVVGKSVLWGSVMTIGVVVLGTIVKISIPTSASIGVLAGSLYGCKKAYNLTCCLLKFKEP